jgi:flagellar biosynthesis/type III secretory pathway chaperone
MYPVTAILNQLIDVLEQSEVMYQALLALAEREKAAALGCKHQLLVQVNAEKEALLAQLDRNDRRRIDLLHRLADDMKMSPAQVCLSELESRADARQATRLGNLRSSLSTLVHRIKRANMENRRLIQHCLDLSRSAMCFFQHWMMPAAVYGSSGRVDSGHRNGKLLSGTV